MRALKAHTSASPACSSNRACAARDGPGGAEVSAELPAPKQVWRALDAEGRDQQLEDIENVGTRHRAAYRFVNDHPDGLAVVISQDGGVSFVANREGRVVFWEQSVSP